MIYRYLFSIDSLALMVKQFCFVKFIINTDQTNQVQNLHLLDSVLSGLCNVNNVFQDEYRGIQRLPLFHDLNQNNA